MVHAPSIKALDLHGGTKCQMRVNMTEVTENNDKKDNVGHGFVVPTLT